jgi:hypothetical protein
MTLRISADALAAGDVLGLHDWRLDVVVVEHGTTIAVFTAQFDFPLHFARHDAVVVDRRFATWVAAA